MKTLISTHYSLFVIFTFLQVQRKRHIGNDIVVVVFQVKTTYIAIHTSINIAVYQLKKNTFLGNKHGNLATSHKGPSSRIRSAVH